jgi:hypothetical protein
MPRRIPVGLGAVPVSQAVGAQWPSPEAVTAARPPAPGARTLLGNRPGVDPAVGVLARGLFSHADSLRTSLRAPRRGKREVGMHLGFGQDHGGLGFDASGAGSRSRSPRRGLS